MGFYNMMSGWGGGWAGLDDVPRHDRLLGRRRRPRHLGRQSSGRTDGSTLGAAGIPGARKESAANVLKRRYAAGEIDAAEFEQKRRDLV